MKVEHDHYAVTYDQLTQGPCIKAGHTLGLVGSPRYVREDYAQKNYVPIGMIGGAREASTYAVERVVPAGIPIYLSVHAVLSVSVGLPTISSTACSQIMEFTPAAGMEYEIRHAHVSGQCRISIDSLSIEGAVAKRTPVADATQHKCS